VQCASLHRVSPIRIRHAAMLARGRGMQPLQGIYRCNTGSVWRAPAVAAKGGLGRLGRPHAEEHRSARQARRLPRSRPRCDASRSARPPASSYVRCQAAQAPQTALSTGSVRGCRCDDRATVGAKPRDVGQHPLIRGFTHVRLFVWGCPCLRTGVDLAIGLKGRSGIPLAAAALPPLHEICLHRTMPRRRLPEVWFSCATHSLRTTRLTWPQHRRW
jgi:hypothetical protein